MDKKEDKKLKIPQIKKKINAFLVGEEGKISKKSLLKAGLVAGMIGMTAGLVQGVDAAHTNNLSLGPYNPGTGATTATHAHHSVHASHSDGGWCCGFL